MNIKKKNTKKINNSKQQNSNLKISKKIGNVRKKNRGKKKIKRGKKTKKNKNNNLHLGSKTKIISKKSIKHSNFTGGEPTPRGGVDSEPTPQGGVDRHLPRSRGLMGKRLEDNRKAEFHNKKKKGISIHRLAQITEMDQGEAIILLEDALELVTFLSENDPDTEDEYSAVINPEKKNPSRTLKRLDPNLTLAQKRELASKKALLRAAALKERAGRAGRGGGRPLENNYMLAYWNLKGVWASFLGINFSGCAIFDFADMAHDFGHENDASKKKYSGALKIQNRPGITNDKVVELWEEYSLLLRDFYASNPSIQSMLGQLQLDEINSKALNPDATPAYRDILTNSKIEDNFFDAMTQKEWWSDDSLWADLLSQHVGEEGNKILFRSNLIPGDSQKIYVINDTECKNNLVDKFTNYEHLSVDINESLSFVVPKNCIDPIGLRKNVLLFFPTILDPSTLLKESYKIYLQYFPYELIYDKYFHFLKIFDIDIRFIQESTTFEIQNNLYYTMKCQIFDGSTSVEMEIKPKWNSVKNCFLVQYFFELVSSYAAAATTSQNINSFLEEIMNIYINKIKEKQIIDSNISGLTRKLNDDFQKILKGTLNAKSLQKLLPTINQLKQVAEIINRDAVNKIESEQFDIGLMDILPPPTVEKLAEMKVNAQEFRDKYLRLAAKIEQITTPVPPTEEVLKQHIDEIISLANLLHNNEFHIKEYYDKYIDNDLKEKDLFKISFKIFDILLEKVDPVNPENIKKICVLVRMFILTSKMTGDRGQVDMIFLMNLLIDINNYNPDSKSDQSPEALKLRQKYGITHNLLTHDFSKDFQISDLQLKHFCETILRNTGKNTIKDAANIILRNGKIINTQTNTEQILATDYFEKKILFISQDRMCVAYAISRRCPVLIIKRTGCGNPKHNCRLYVYIPDD